MSAFIEQITNWDGRFLQGFQNLFHNPLMDRLIPLYTHWGDIGQIWIILGIVLLFWKKTRRSGALLLISLLLTHIFNNIIIKPLIMRPRPYVTFDKIRVLVEPLRSTSFPSGHTATAFGSTMILGLREKGWLRGLPLTGAVLMAFSRLYVGAHYLTDVLAGAILGTLIALICAVIFRQGEKRFGRAAETSDKTV